MIVSRALAGLFVALALCASAPAARGQAVEIGGHVTYLDLGIFDTSHWGTGGRFGVEVLPFVTLEAEVNAFGGGDSPAGAFVQALGGVKLGGRTPTYGLFAKLRPGIVRFDEDFIQPGTACIAVVPTPRECLATRTNTALDFGTAIELYPSSRLTLRADIGTTYIWFGSQGDQRARRYGNFQVTIGAGVRF